jgi:hypothetical protein
MLGRIVDSSEYRSGIVLLIESTGGAGNDTLTAVDAGGICQLQTVGRLDFCIVTTIGCTDGTNALQLVTSSNTAAAKDTLGIVTNDGNRRIVDIEDLLIGGEVVFIYTVLVAELLQFTGGRTNAGEALLVVSRENQLQIGLTGSLNLLRIGENLHAIRYGIYTGGNQTAGTGNLNEAQTARTDFIDIFQIAEGRNVDSGNSGGLEDGRIGRNLYLNAVDFYFYHIHFMLRLPSYFLEIAPNLHFSIQAPHLMHLEGSMMWASLTLPEIAPAGQTLEQSVQPLHLSASMV